MQETSLNGITHAGMVTWKKKVTVFGALLYRILPAVSRL